MKRALRSPWTRIKNLDIVVAATGFIYNFPFLAHILNQPNTFYRRMLPVEKCLGHGLAFVMIAYTRINPPFAEMHAHWLCHNFLPKQYIDDCGFLYSEEKRPQMTEAIAKLAEELGDTSSYIYNVDMNPFKTMHELANEINALSSDHEALLASPVKGDVKWRVALYHAPFTTLR